MLNSFQHLKAFTLAEVLITLAIIGVVAALTIPTVVRNYRATQYETSLKKAHSVINNAVNLMRADFGTEISRQTISVGTFANSFKKYFSTIKDCAGSSCFDEATPKYRNYNNTANLEGIKTYFADGGFILKDGMTLFFDDDGYDLRISVDINGHKKAPNRYGHDLFSFSLTSGKFLPSGAPGTKYNLCNGSHADVANGVGCTYQALKDKDFFKKLPK